MKKMPIKQVSGNDKSVSYETLHVIISQNISTSTHNSEYEILYCRRLKHGGILDKNFISYVSVR